ncbi:MAG: hypothetical protein IKR68_03420 [Lachnospiraceae bacterium]|nr:hypothetical protein [Lachnospiraceae bacterium]
MKKTKRLVALLLALILTMGSIMPVHAGLFAKKLTAPTTCSGQWQGDDFYVVWDKVPGPKDGDRWQVYGEPSYYVNTGVFK